MCKQGTAKEINAYLLCHVIPGFKIIYIYIKKTNYIYIKNKFTAQRANLCSLNRQEKINLVKSFEEILMVALEIITFRSEVFKYPFESSILSN